MRKIFVPVVTATLFLFSATHVFASTALTLGGHVGLVGQYSSSSTPNDTTYSSFRVPIGLMFQARPTDNLNIYLGLDYAYNNYPENQMLLGQTNNTKTDNNGGLSTPLPFSSYVNKNISNGQKTDQVSVTQAYFSYQTPIGLLRAGRMPRNWGLGIWLSDVVSPSATLPSTSDAVALLSDFGLFDVNLYYEKYGKGIGGTNNGGDATAYSVEARLKADPADTPSTGYTKEIGIAFSKFNHDDSDTALNILDIYSKIYVSNFFIGGEILYPSGKTRSPNYQNLGGSSSCNGTDSSETCFSQTLSSLAALFKLKFQLGDFDSTSLASTEKAKSMLGTEERNVSHIFDLWTGYASGGSNQFQYPNSLGSDNMIRAAVMNPQIQPGFLMFNSTTPQISGMPGGIITNTTFVKASYTYENPSLGSFEPGILWAVLNRTNDQIDNKQNEVCHPNENEKISTSYLNKICVGGSKNLGVELDISYRYTTLDRVTFGADGGYWFVGEAWHVYGQASPKGNYGLRAFVGTEF